MPETEVPVLSGSSLNCCQQREIPFVGVVMFYKPSNGRCRSFPVEPDLCSRSYEIANYLHLVRVNPDLEIHHFGYWPKWM